VDGALAFKDIDGLIHLPHGLQVTRLNMNRCAGLRALPRGLRCRDLVIWDAPVASVPKVVRVEQVFVLGREPAWRTLPATVAAAPLDLLRLTYNSRLRALPVGIRVAGELDVNYCPSLAALPDGLRLHALDADGCTSLRQLLEDLQVTSDLDVRDCTRLERLPAGLRLLRLDASGCTRLRALPADLAVSDELVLTNCTALEALPEGLAVCALYLGNCASLRVLPQGLRVQHLYIFGCTTLDAWPPDGLPPTLTRLVMRDCAALTEWPASGPPVLRELDMRGCTGLRALPPWLRQVGELNLAGCVNLHALPEHLRVTGWLDLGDTPLRALPPSPRGYRLRWRGVAIPGRVALHPETIRAKEVLDEPNAEVRRVMLERMGYERFMSETKVEVLDRDRDAGGSRRLLRVPIENDEPLVCLSVHDPSTGRRYLLRVPPTMETCRQAAAWIAGFDDPDNYRPVAET
jgi:hypothetical protein